VKITGHDERVEVSNLFHQKYAQIISSYRTRVLLIFRPSCVSNNPLYLNDLKITNCGCKYESGNSMGTHIHVFILEKTIES
jgi:hypothetical protein